MARARNIKPGFFKNEHIVELSFEARVLFIGLWTLADREGRLEDRPKQIKMELLPADDVNVDELLNELALSEGEFISRYEVEGKKYIQITNFLKHQNPHMKETASVLPGMPETLKDQHHASTMQAPECNHASPADSLNLIPDSLNLIPEVEPAKNGGSSKKGTRLPKDWFPSNELLEWAKKERVDLDVLKEQEKFADYWNGVAGSRGVKLDWDATWRNWMRSARGNPIKPQNGLTLGRPAIVPASERTLGVQKF